MTFQFELHVN